MLTTIQRISHLFRRRRQWLIAPAVFHLAFILFKKTSHSRSILATIFFSLAIVITANPIAFAAYEFDPVTIEAIEKTPLTKAALNNDLERAKRLLTQGADVNRINQGGYHALLVAALADHQQMVKWLIANGASVNLAGNTGITPLMGAALANKPNSAYIVQLLIENGADIEAKDEEQATALIVATAQQAMPVVNLLLNHGANANVKDRYQGTPIRYSVMGPNTDIMAALMRYVTIPDDEKTDYLFLAIDKPNADTLKFLLANGIDPDVKNKAGESAFNYAMKAQGGVNIIKTLLAAKTTLYRDNDVESYLFNAIDNPNPSTLEWLLVEKGVDANTRHQLNIRALAYAIKAKASIDHLQTLIRHQATLNNLSAIEQDLIFTILEDKSTQQLKTLLMNGLDVNIKNRQGQTLIANVMQFEGGSPLIKLLIEYGADINSVGPLGFTPLIYAARASDLRLVQLLIEKGANLNARNENGNTALIYAANRNSVAMVKALLAAGADPTIANSQGQTADSFKTNAEIIQLLTEK